MEAFKITLFERDCGLSFPHYEELKIESCEDLKFTIAQKFNLENQNIGEELFALLKYCDFANADENFNFKEMLSKLEIIPNRMLYLDWGDFNNVDLISVDDFNKHFYDIWYPVSDDINIFDETLNWFVYISHYDAVYYLKNT